MWVAKSPVPFDFCGCPPCPICFDFMGGDSAPRVPGMQKFISDLMGGKKPTKTQTEELEKAASEDFDGLVVAVQDEAEESELGARIYESDEGRHGVSGLFKHSEKFP